MTSILIIIPFILQFISSLNYLLQNPFQLCLELLFLILSLFGLFTVSTTNPGYLPKQMSYFARIPRNSQTLHGSIIYEGNIENPLTKQYYVTPVQLCSYRIKYCGSCYLVRPPRTTHCPECDCCVERFDHHCPWLGICIGKKNQKEFIAFLYATLGLMMVSTAAAVFTILEESENSASFTEVLEDSAGNIIFILYVTSIGWFLGAITVFQTWLVFNNLTSKEFLKPERKMNIFYRGCLENIKHFFTLKGMKNWFRFDQSTKELGNIHDIPVSMIAVKEDTGCYRKDENVRRSLKKTSETFFIIN